MQWCYTADSVSFSSLGLWHLLALTVSQHFLAALFQLCLPQCPVQSRKKFGPFFLTSPFSIYQNTTRQPALGLEKIQNHNVTMQAQTKGWCRCHRMPSRLAQLCFPSKWNLFITATSRRTAWKQTKGGASAWWELASLWKTVTSVHVVSPRRAKANMKRWLSVNPALIIKSAKSED